jgi:hypothetical protein
MTQHHSQRCDGGGISRERADRIVKEHVTQRVRFTFGTNTEFTTASDAWAKASPEDKRRVLSAVVDRVVIEPRAPGEAVTVRRRLRIHWKRAFTGTQLVAAPLEPIPVEQLRHVRDGRAPSNRALRTERHRAELSRRSKAYFNEWRAFQKARILDAELREHPKADEGSDGILG